MNQLLTISITAIIVYSIQEYRHRIMKPVRFEQKPPLIEIWHDFITANINMCFTQLHCHKCIELINLFGRKFKGVIPPGLLNEEMQNMWNRLDTKYKALKREDEMSDTTTDQLIK